MITSLDIDDKKFLRSNERIFQIIEKISKEMDEKAILSSTNHEFHRGIAIGFRALLAECKESPFRSKGK